jgi:dihydroxyacetone kinase
MGVGIGIHGEPGIDETDVPTADGLAELFVSTLLAELPDGIASAEGQRAGVILNGLGSVKYEELFVVYRAAKDSILTFGAVVGDNTMVDALVPFADTLSREIDGGAPLADPWARAADASSTAAAATADLLPLIGRARPHAEKSLGSPDAGAHSFALIVQRLATVLKEQEK